MSCGVPQLFLGQAWQPWGAEEAEEQSLWPQSVKDLEVLAVELWYAQDSRLIKGHLSLMGEYPGVCHTIGTVQWVRR